MKHGSLFSGIGGFDLAAEWMQWENMFHCELTDFNRRILKHYWPNSISYEDITKTDFTIWKGKIDILTGGFPCQPYSVAGKQLGTEDDRHLWPEMLRAIREIQPRWIVGENVRGLVNWNGGMVFEQVQADLEAEGYEVFAFLLPAASVNAPHRRDRIWFVAYSQGERGTEVRSTRFFIVPNSPSKRGNENHGKRESRFINKASKVDDWRNFPTQHPIRNGDDGLPSKLDGIAFLSWWRKSIQGGGNAIVPQLALQIFKAIEKFENE